MWPIYMDETLQLAPGMSQMQTSLMPMPCMDKNKMVAPVGNPAVFEVIKGTNKFKSLANVSSATISMGLKHPGRSPTSSFRNPWGTSCWSTRRASTGSRCRSTDPPYVRGVFFLYDVTRASHSRMRTVFPEWGSPMRTVGPACRPTLAPEGPGARPAEPQQNRASNKKRMFGKFPASWEIWAAGPCAKRLDVWKLA